MMRVTFLLLPVVAFNLLAQAPILNQLEKEFQDSLAGATLEGQSTHDGKPGVAEDHYNIERVEKTSGDNWTFYVRMNMQGKEVTLPLPIEVKWAGDTPVITLTDKSMPGMGTYTARVVIYRGNYAGTWSGRNGGGKIFGKIVKK